MSEAAAPSEPENLVDFVDLDATDVVSILRSGDIEVEGRMPYSSNATLLVTITDADDSTDRSIRAIYKPGQGERPLWDFPAGLYKREAAMYRLAAAIGWDVIPPTTITEGPFGEGSVQAFVDAEFDQHYFTLWEAGRGIADLERLCVLDLVANNTDRKSGHCLIAHNGRVYGIDHGLAFHAQWKLRTVMWDFVGEPIPDPLLADLRGFVDSGLPSDLAALLDPIEQDAVLARARAVVTEAHFPADDTDGHRYPWPLV